MDPAQFYVNRFGLALLEPTPLGRSRGLLSSPINVLRRAGSVVFDRLVLKLRTIDRIKQPVAGRERSFISEPLQRCR
jgi:hypothetical protein